MRHETWYERYAWVWFVAVALVGLVLAALTMINPSSGTDVMSRFGFDVPPTIERDAAATSYLETVFEWAAVQTFGFDLMAVFIAATAFRAGHRWAWVVFWFWPVMFLSHFVMYESSFQYAQLLWLVLSVAALAATYRRTWRRGLVDAVSKSDRNVGGHSPAT